MKKQGNIKSILLIVYIVVILGIYLWLSYPVVVQPRGLMQSKIPSFSVSGLVEAKGLFSSRGKEWVQYPSEPDLSNFSFGNKDPI